MAVRHTNFASLVQARHRTILLKKDRQQKALELAAAAAAAAAAEAEANAITAGNEGMEGNLAAIAFGGEEESNDTSKADKPTGGDTIRINPGKKREERRKQREAEKSRKQAQQQQQQQQQVPGTPSAASLSRTTSRSALSSRGEHVNNQKNHEEDDEDDDDHVHDNDPRLAALMRSASGILTKEEIYRRMGETHKELKMDPEKMPLLGVLSTGQNEVIMYR